MDINLVVDNREKKIFTHLDNTFNQDNYFQNRGNITHTKETIEIGDYRIESENEILCIIERKTLKDYAASQKDGRHDNKEKLVKLREECGCKIMYIIEGPANPSFDTEFAGIKYINILSSIRHLQIIQDIHIIRSVSGEQTARLLRHLCEMYSEMCNRPDYNGRLIEGNYESKEDILERARPSAEYKFKKAIIDIWTIKRRIGKTYASVLARNFTISQMINGEITQEQLDNIRVNERRLPVNVKKSVLDAGNEDNRISGEIHLELLKNTKGISKSSAEMILIMVKLPYFVNPDNIDDCKSVRISSKSTIGKKRLENIIEMYTTVVSE